MASVYLGSLAGAADFSRVVAIKRMLPQFASDPAFVARFRDEAWLSARLLHPSIVQTFDVVDRDGELLLIMEYVDGVSLRALLADASAAGHQLPISVVAGILVPVLHGLHAAHETTDDEGRALGIVHRDVSPQNIVIGRDGHAKILDFGIAKARSHAHVTVVGEFTGKFGYLSPEQVHGSEIDRRTDVFAAGIVLWEALAGQRLFRERGLEQVAVIHRVLTKIIPPPSKLNPAVARSVDAAVLRALLREPARRFATARDLALALEAAIPLASPSTVSDCVQSLCAPRLSRLSRTLASARRRSMFATKIHSERTELARMDTVVSAPVLTSNPPRQASLRQRHWIQMALVAGLLVLAGSIAWAQRGGFGSRPNQPPPSSSALACVADPAALSVPGASQVPSVNSEQQPQPANSRQEMVPSRDLPNSRSLPRGPKARPHRATAPVRVPPTSPPPPPARSLCDPPTYLDSAGIRHFKNGCL